MSPYTVRDGAFLLALAERTGQGVFTCSCALRPIYRSRVVKAIGEAATAEIERVAKAMEAEEAQK